MAYFNEDNVTEQMCINVAEQLYMHHWRRLGIARTNKFVGLCARLAQAF